MMRQPDDRSWEEEFIHNQGIEIEKLTKQLKLAESVISKIIPSDSNQRQMITSYKQFTQK